MFKIHKLIHFTCTLLRRFFSYFYSSINHPPSTGSAVLLRFWTRVVEKLSLNYQIFHRPPVETISVEKERREGFSVTLPRESTGINYADND